ncbi:MAG: L-glutamate gamma-semialdehyde dehydrogenase, partial [Nitrososphaera sp.]
MFENENTLHRFMTEKAEGEFHDRYERALEQVRSEFGRRYPMIIGGKEVRTTETIAEPSPIDTRIVLGHLPRGGSWHTRQAIAAANKAF